MANFVNYRETQDRKKRNLILLSFVAIVIVLGILVFKFYPKEVEAPPEISTEQLIFTSNIDADQQSQVKVLTDYNWAFVLNTSLQNPDAIRAVPHLATLELETAIDQYELLKNSERYVSAETLELLSSDDELTDIMENLAIIENAYYDLGLPAGIIHSKRFEHLANRLEIYGPPLGPINDIETRLFVGDHLGATIDTYEQWYALIRIKYFFLISDMEENKDKKSILTIEDYSGNDLTISDVVPVG